MQLRGVDGILPQGPILPWGHWASHATFELVDYAIVQPTLQPLGPKEAQCTEARAYKCAVSNSGVTDGLLPLGRCHRHLQRKLEADTEGGFEDM